MKKVSLKHLRKIRVNFSALCLLGSLGLVVPNAQATESQLSYIAMTPCRAVDTRGIGTSGTFGTPSMLAGIKRDFQLWKSPNCIGIPSTVKAYSLNITVVPSTGELSYLTIWPAGSPQPGVSTLNSPFGSVVANAATITAGTGGSVSVYVTDVTDVIIDVSGYYADLSGSTGPIGLTGATGRIGPAGETGTAGPARSDWPHWNRRSHRCNGRRRACLSGNLEFCPYLFHCRYGVLQRVELHQPSGVKHGRPA